MQASRSSLLLCRAVQWFLLAGLLALTAHAQKIQVTYGPNLDFAKFKTFAWPRSGADDVPHCGRG